MTNKNSIAYRKAGRPTRKPNNEQLAMLYENFSAKEIAQLYGVTQSTVYSWVCRARQEQKSV